MAPEAEDGDMPVYFSLLAPQPGAQEKLLMTLQAEIVAPLVSRGLLREFRVLSATPPSLAAQDSTLLVFELIVPRPWPIGTADLREWQRRLGQIRLTLIESKATDWRSLGRSRSALEQGMTLSSRGAASPTSSSWLESCTTKRSKFGDEALAIQRRSSTELPPVLFFKDDRSLRRFRFPARSTALSESMAFELNQTLPPALRWKTAWRLAYSPKVHGRSLQTLLRRAAQEGPSLLVVQDQSGHVFGGFAPQPWQVNERFYGTGQSFVFSFRHPLPKPTVTLTRQLTLIAEGRLPQGEDLAEPASPSSAANGDCDEESAEEAVRLAVTRAMIDMKAVNCGEDDIQPCEDGQARPAIGSYVKILDKRNNVPWLCVGEVGRLAKDERNSRLPLAVRMPDGMTIWVEVGQVKAVESPLEEAEGVLGAGLGLHDGADTTDLGLEVFAWSEENSFFLYSPGDCLGMGGGSGFALYLDADLTHGVSESCTTFGSPRLAASENFTISDLELWVFDDPLPC